MVEEKRKQVVNMSNILRITDTIPEGVVKEALESGTVEGVIVEEFPDADFIERVAALLRDYSAKHIVVDLKSITNSSHLIEAVTGLLLPMAEVVIPSIPEAEVLDRMSVTSDQDMEMAAKNIADHSGASVILFAKGIFAAKNLLYTSNQAIWFDKDLTSEEITKGLTENKPLTEIVA